MGASDSTAVPQTMEGTFIFSEGKCQIVESSTMFRIWLSETNRNRVDFTSLFQFKRVGRCAQKELASALENTPYASDNSLMLSFELETIRTDTRNPG